MNTEFRYYMHDGPSAFSFELAGSLSDRAARELEHARRSASSTLGERSLIVDLSYVTQVGDAGRTMLRGWYDSGAQLVARRPQSQAIVESITGHPPPRIADAIQSRTWRPVGVVAAVAASLLCALVMPVRVMASDLQPKTVQVWEDYVKSVTDRDRALLASGSQLPAGDANLEDASRARQGEIVVTPAGPTFR